MAGFDDVQGLRVGFTNNTEFHPSPAIIARDLNTFGNEVSSFKEPLQRAVKEVLIPSFQQNFNQGGRPAWKALADYTVAVRGNSKPILVRSGRLKRTMGQESIWTITDEHAVIARLPSGSWYGGIHQEGNNKNVPIPARPFALIQPQDEEKIEQVFSQWLGEQAKKAGWD